MCMIQYVWRKMGWEHVQYIHIYMYIFYIVINYIERYTAEILNEECPKESFRSAIFNSDHPPLSGKPTCSGHIGCHSWAPTLCPDCLKIWRSWMAAVSKMVVGVMPNKDKVKKQNYILHFEWSPPWHHIDTYVTNSDTLCAKIWRGREGDDNSDEI